ncbi:hypothetical protein HDU76_003544 [Blyttiomyces sp. JEL0837]|nr:hypothetical protein HDU76_003544 [Blyttiomyces sp. JEL0837]
MLGSSVTKVAIPEQKQHGEKTFPYVLSPQVPTILSETLPKVDGVPTFTTADEAVAWAKENRDELRARLIKHGAILFRGFPLPGPEAFSDFTQALGVTPLPYVGGAAPRYSVYKDVHTTNESPPDQLIPFHHEMAQVPVYPKTVLFFCDGEPKEGGETPLCPSDVAFARLQEAAPEFAKNIEELGVIYTRVVPEKDDPSSPIGRGWTSTFQTTDREEAIKVAKNLNVNLEWLENGDVKTVSPVLQAVKEYPATGKKVWFNSVVAAYVGWQDSRNDRTKAVLFGDGTQINPADIDKMQEIMSEICAVVPWKKGDVVWVDNEQTLHARKSFVPPRRILAYLGRN